MTVYGRVAEADIGLGKYAEAETSVQWTINTRPNNVAGLILGADLRELYGDASGAVDFLNQAYSFAFEESTAQTAVAEYCTSRRGMVGATRH